MCSVNQCGYKNDRDVKSAICIKAEGTPTEHRDFKPEENLSYTFFDTLSEIDGIRVSKIKSLSQETAVL
jgi:hypothetical protein